RFGRGSGRRARSPWQPERRPAATAATQPPAESRLRLTLVVVLCRTALADWVAQQKGGARDTRSGRMARAARGESRSTRPVLRAGLRVEDPSRPEHARVRHVPGPVLESGWRVHVGAAQG